MPQFLFLGNQWINVDKITGVRFRPDAKTAEPCAEVWYGSAAAHVDLNVEETKRLVEYLKKHSAEL